MMLFFWVFLRVMECDSFRSGYIKRVLGLLFFINDVFKEGIIFLITFFFINVREGRVRGGIF